MSTRKNIRKRFVDGLVKNTSAGEKVNVNHHSYDQPYPFLTVDIPIDESRLIDCSVRATEHKLFCEVNAVDRSDLSQIHDRLDDLAVEIQAVVEKDASFGNILNSCALTKTEMEVMDEGERSIGFLRLTYECEYIERW